MGDKLACNQNGESDIARHAPSQGTGTNLAEKGERSKSQSTFRSKDSDSEQVPTSQAVSKDIANPPDSADGQAESPPKPSETEESGALSSEPIAVPVVGIGASAGGLEALQTLFENMPESTGLSYIIVQHISPTGKSALAPLLRRYTRMPVEQASNGLKPQPDCIYTNPPHKQIALFNGKIELMEPTGPHPKWMPIDYFFRTLAQDLRQRAVGIVLSGTGSDGTQGLRAINGNGGIVLVQDPNDAGHSGMPQNGKITRQ